MTNRPPAAVSNVAHHRRITSLAAWDGSPSAREPMRWSETVPPVLPRQTVISVEVSDGDTSNTGVASLTYYVPPEEDGDDGRVDGSLAAWLGAPVSGPATRRRPENPYDPSGKPLGATVELAVLDALGRATNLPAAAFLGGPRRTRIEAYASLPSFAEPSSAVECAGAAVGHGFRAIKFHASGTLETDIETIAAARRELGPSVRLMWDASCAYELYTAVAIGVALAEARFLWFEAPLADESTEALRSLASRTTMALVPDGLVQRSAGEWARDVRDGVWAALRLDVTRTPDLACALRLLHLSETLGLPCEIQSFGFPLGQYSNLQLMLTTGACRFFESPFPTDDFLDDIVAPPVLVDGFVDAPEAPGLGHAVEAQDLARRLRPLAEMSI
jgi:L-alanine-DL-glutamate epimerase-like enolase superfamily enzyme